METEVRLPNSDWRFNDLEAWNVFQRRAIAHARKVQQQLLYQKTKRIAAYRPKSSKYGIRRSRG